MCIPIGLFSPIELKSLVEESLLMSTLNNPNVMMLIGVCIDSHETPYLVMPYMTRGNLLTFLRKNREELMVNDNEENKEMVIPYFVSK